MQPIYSTNTMKHSKLSNLVLLFLLALLSLFITSGSFTQELNIPGGINTWKPSVVGNPLDNPYTATRTNFTITMRDNVIIDCLKWIPNAPAPVGGWPTVIMVHGYGDSKETLSEFCRLQAEYGYYTMTFSVRGQGLSGGLSNLISRTEALDLQEIVNFVRKDTVNGVGKDKILIMGGSQGGALPLMASSMPGGLNVKGIINSVAPPNFASSWIENGCSKMTLLWTIEYTPDTARYNGQVNRMSDWIYADNKQYWDSLAYWLPKDRDFTNIIQNNTVPVLIEASWQDKFFNADGWLQNINKITSPMSSYMGAVQGHGGDHSLTEDQWHMDWFNNFFFQTIWGMQTNIFSIDKYQYGSTIAPHNGQYWSFRHDSTSTLVKSLGQNTRLYFNDNNRLKTTANTNNWLPDVELFSNDVRNNYTLKQAVLDEFKGTNFTNNFKIDKKTFDSNPLTAATEMTGTPSMKIDYIGTAEPFIQFNFQIYEVFPNGTAKFVTRLNYMDRNNNYSWLPERKTATFRGAAHSHVFSAGSKIRIVLTNLDRTTEEASFFNGTNPFMLPTMKKGISIMLLTSNFYVDLPIVSGSGDNNDLFAAETSSFINETPEKFELKQNFPNPFNPNTVITYSVAKSENVQIRVYDITGKEVQTLVNEVKSPGSYNIMFNAANLSSGVYFYRIIAGNFTEVKKMTLVK
jgi:predicted acyl esterase